MISPCAPQESPVLPPGAPAPQAPSVPPPPPPPPNISDLTFPLLPNGLAAPAPPPPPPPPPPARGVAPPHVFGLEKSQLLKEALEKAGPVPGSREDVKRLLKLQKDRSDLRWLLFCADLPSLIQEGPQCGLVALWMAGALLVPPSGVPLERLVQVARDRGFTAHGEMFSVADMGRLAQEVLGCRAELLCGGLGPPNRDRILRHLLAGHPLLIPYDEDFNHEPCQRRGHKAHWAVSAGVLLGVPRVPDFGYAEDPELPGLFVPVTGVAHQPPPLPEDSSPGLVYLLAKQGKSWHCLLWDYEHVRESNQQLTDFSPARAADGRTYVLPAGGVRAGLCGQALLLTPQGSGH